MELSKYQFDLLTFIEKNDSGKYNQRYLSDMLTISLGTINKVLSQCLELQYLTNINGKLAITEKGLEALKPYKVKKAIIIAAGFGSRLAPVTLDTPKPLIKVNGTRIIDTLLDALLEKEITDIVIVRGYKKEVFDELLEKYPMIRFVDNELYNITNNISSIMKVINEIDCCYICEADLLIQNKDLIQKYEYYSNYLGAKVLETDDWCFTKKGKYIDKYQLGGEECYQAFGISFWNAEDSAKLRKDIVKVFNSYGGKENFWEAVPFRACKKNYQIEIKECTKADLLEFDTYLDLVLVDTSYKDYPNHDKY